MMDTYFCGEIHGVSDALSRSRLVVADMNGCLVLLDPNPATPPMELRFPASERNPSGGFKHLLMCFNAHIEEEKDGIETMKAGVVFLSSLRGGGNQLVFQVFQTEKGEEVPPSQPFRLVLSQQSDWRSDTSQCIWVAGSKWAVSIDHDVFLVDVASADEIPPPDMPGDTIDAFPLHTFPGKVRGIKSAGGKLLTFGTNWIALYDIHEGSMRMFKLKDDDHVTPPIDGVWSFVNGPNDGNALFIWAGVNIYCTQDMTKEFLERNACVFKARPECVTLFKEDDSESMNVVGAYSDTEGNTIILKFDQERKKFAHMTLDTVRDEIQLFSLEKNVSSEKSLVACSSRVWDCSHHNKIVCLDLNTEEMTDILSARDVERLILIDGKKKAHQSWPSACAKTVHEEALSPREKLKSLTFPQTRAWSDYYWALFCATQRAQNGSCDSQPIIIHRGEKTTINFPMEFHPDEGEVGVFIPACDLFATHEGKMDDMICLKRENIGRSKDALIVDFTGLTPGRWTISMIFGRFSMRIEKVVEVLDAPCFEEMIILNGK
jgi:hypothetical protein